MWQFRIREWLFWTFTSQQESWLWNGLDEAVKCKPAQKEVQKRVFEMYNEEKICEANCRDVLGPGSVFIRFDRVSVLTATSFIAFIVTYCTSAAFSAGTVWALTAVRQNVWEGQNERVRESKSQSKSSESSSIQHTIQYTVCPFHPEPLCFIYSGTAAQVKSKTVKWLTEIECTTTSEQCYSLKSEVRFH